MNGAHDLGGMQGFGPVDPEPDEPVFHHEWERRVLALTLAMGYQGRWNMDETRHARESLPPPVYLSLSYYEIWFEALNVLLVRHGFASAGEIEAGRPAGGGPDCAAMSAAELRDIVRAGTSTRREEIVAGRFVPGDPVRVRNVHPRGHTRMPRYVRGRQGVIYRNHGVYDLPDSHAHGLGADPQHCYSVRFDARELWGESAENSAVYADLWDSYLVPVP